MRQQKDVTVVGMVISIAVAQQQARQMRRIMAGHSEDGKKTIASAIAIQTMDKNRDENRACSKVGIAGASKITEGRLSTGHAIRDGRQATGKEHMATNTDKAAAPPPLGTMKRGATWYGIRKMKLLLAPSDRTLNNTKPTCSRRRKMHGEKTGVSKRNRGTWTTLR